MGIIKEFKEFAVRGNVLDMAIGVVIGGAFGKIVSAIVSDIIMPPIGVLVSGMNFFDLKWIIKKAGVDAAGVEIPEVTINYGSFIQTVFDFVIIAFAIFMLVKAINKLHKKDKKLPEPAADPAPTKEEILLTEIRDLLKKQQ